MAEANNWGTEYVHNISTVLVTMRDKTWQGYAKLNNFLNRIGSQNLRNRSIAQPWWEWNYNDQ